MFQHIHLSRKVLLPILFFISISVLSQDSVFLSPQPKKIEFLNGNFEFTKKIKICPPHGASNETIFTYTQLINELDKTFPKSTTNCKRFRQSSIRIGLIGRDKIISKEIQALNLELPDSAREEGYILKISKQHILIAAYSESGLFYGVQTLKQVIRLNRHLKKLPCLIITDWPSLRYRGWMDDISRGPIPTMEFLKSCIRKMAEYKQNCVTLYTEHVFKLINYPDLAPYDGLSAEQLKELSDYAALYHIDLIGNFQSFGHFARILSNPFFSNLGENNDILNPSDDSSYEFLSNIYKEIVPSYKSQFFNINCDETFGLGEGKSKELAAKIGLHGLYSNHINRIDQLLKPYNKRIMMWGDIAVNNPAIISQLPEDLVILSWGYHAAENFENDILPFKKTGFDFMVAPGISCWNEIWPGLSNAVINISNYVRDGHKLGALGMLNTAWDDNGHNLFNSNWHGLIWGAECSWNPALPSHGEVATQQRNARLKTFNQSFDRLFFEYPGITNILLSIDSLRNYPVPGILNEWGFWSDILDFNAINTSSSYVLNNETIKARAEFLAKQVRHYIELKPANIEMLKNAELALLRIIFTADKNIIRALLHSIKQTHDKLLINQAKNQLKDLKAQLYNIKKIYINLWMNENRGWWLDKNLNDYNKLAESIDMAEYRVFIEPVSLLQENGLSIKIADLFNEGNIHFTLDGTEPNINSPLYVNGVTLKESALVKARVIKESYNGPVSEQYICYHSGIGNLHKLNSHYSTYNPTYSAGGDTGLVDGLKGSDSFSDGRWQGYQGQDLDIELDLKEISIVNGISVDFLQSSYSWILLPKDVEIQVSNDGVNYESIEMIIHNIPRLQNRTLIHTFKSKFNPLKTRYIRLIAHNSGTLPDGHHAAGYPSFIFADEIIIR